MTFYYVGGDGGADAGDTARFASRQTGTFPASSYSTIAGVLDGTLTTTDIALGDTICVKDTYANSQASTISYAFHGTVGGDAIRIESVDATAAETLKEGATDTCTGGSADLLFIKVGQSLFFYGINLVSGDDIKSSSNNQSLHFRKCSFNASDNLGFGSDGCYARFEECDFVRTDAGSVMTLANGALAEYINCTTSGFASTFFISGTGINGGLQVYATGCDFTNLSAAANIIAGVGNNIDDDNIIARLHNCEMLSGQSAFQETPLDGGSLTVFEAIAADNADAFKYEYSSNYGQVLHSTSTYVTSDTVPEGVTPGYSYQVNTSANCSKGAPFRWMLPVGYADLSVASTDTIRVRITSATSLTQEDIAVFVGTSNTTTNTSMDFISTAESKAESSAWIPDHTATGGTALATDASEWTNAQTNEYAITVTPTNVDATSPLYPTVWIEAYKDVTFFVSSQLVFEA